MQGVWAVESATDGARFHRAPFETGSQSGTLARTEPTAGHGCYFVRVGRGTTRAGAAASALNWIFLGGGGGI